MSLPLTLAGALIATGALAPADTSGRGQDRYDRQEVVQALVFSEGELARELALPKPKAHDDRSTEAQSFKADLVDGLLNRPELNEVMHGLESGDPWVVEESMYKLNELVTQEVSTSSATLLSETPQCGFIAVCGAISVAALALGAVTAVVVGNVFMTVNKVTFDHFGRGDMMTQKYVADLTVALDGAIAED